MTQAPHPSLSHQMANHWNRSKEHEYKRQVYQTRHIWDGLFWTEFGGLNSINSGKTDKLSLLSGGLYKQV